MGATDHYRVRPTALDTEAQAATGQADTQQGLATAVVAAPLPAEAFGRVPASSRFATFSTTTLRGLSDAVHDLTTAVRTVAQGVKDSAAGYRTADAQVAAGFDALAKTAATAAPKTVSSGSWTPATGAFADQINANHAKIQQALTDEKSHLSTLQSVLGLDPSGGVVAGQIAESERRIALYQDILDHDRKFVVFDPSGQGRSIEMVGDIDANTRNVFVYTPGTHARLGNEQDAYDVVNSFVQASPDRSVAGFVYQDGDFPQSLFPAAASPSYSQTMAPKLADFSHQLDAQIAANAPGADVRTTGMAWSYGGAVLGLADKAGAHFDNEIYVEGAGMGHGVEDPSQLQQGVTRYAMTAPKDPIHYIQGVELFGLGHGADPDTFPGTITLDSGNAVDGSPITSHDGWQQVHSDAWENLYRVISGGRAPSGGDVR